MHLIVLVTAVTAWALIVAGVVFNHDWMSLTGVVTLPISLNLQRLWTVWTGTKADPEHILAYDSLRPLCGDPNAKRGVIARRGNRVARRDACVICYALAVENGMVAETEDPK